MSKVIENYKTFFVDVDDTLILWEVEKYPNLPRVTLDMNSYSSILAIHEKNREVLVKFAHLGYTIVVWSQSGHDWAQAVCEAMCIDEYVDYYMTKPRFYMDDLPVSQWLSERIWIDPNT